MFDPARVGSYRSVRLERLLNAEWLIPVSTCRSFVAGGQAELVDSSLLRCYIIVRHSGASLRDGEYLRSARDAHL